MYYVRQDGICEFHDDVLEDWMGNFISVPMQLHITQWKTIFRVNALNGLFSFLRGLATMLSVQAGCVNALSGLLSFLRYPLKTLVNTGFPASFLQVFVRIFLTVSSFSCMFTIWTYLTRQIFPNPEFTIAQNYSSVILFFHQNYRRTHSLISL